MIFIMTVDFSLRGWIRATSKKHEKAQIEALAAIGCTNVYNAATDITADLIRELRKGDTVCMTTFARVSNRRNDLAPFRKAVHAKHAVILEVSTGRRSDNADQAIEMFTSAISELTGEARGMTETEAKRQGAKGGKAFGKSAATKRTSIPIAKSVWYDPKAGTVRQRLARDELRGWSLTTAYRVLGKIR